jgi:hypothetical protein
LLTKSLDEFAMTDLQLTHIPRHNGGVDDVRGVTPFRRCGNPRRAAGDPRHAGSHWRLHRDLRCACLAAELRCSSEDRQMPLGATAHDRVNTRSHAALWRRRLVAEMNLQAAGEPMIQKPAFGGVLQQNRATCETRQLGRLALYH